MNILIILSAILFCSIYTSSAQKIGVTGPHLIVYKTKKNYKDLVPVVLSEDRTKVVSYPDPHDLKTAGSNLAPTTLHSGYLMDNYGVGANTAFLKLSQTEYAKLKKLPTTEELYKLILDKNPLTTLYDCGSKNAYKEPVYQVNKLIDKKKLQSSCKTLLKK